MSSCRIRDWPTAGGIGDGGTQIITKEGFGGLRISEGGDGII